MPNHLNIKYTVNIIKMDTNDKNNLKTNIYGINIIE